MSFLSFYNSIFQYGHLYINLIDEQWDFRRESKGANTLFFSYHEMNIHLTMF